MFRASGLCSPAAAVPVKALWVRGEQLGVLEVELGVGGVVV